MPLGSFCVSEEGPVIDECEAECETQGTLDFEEFEHLIENNIL
jgi:hypothetical protein